MGYIGRVDEELVVAFSSRELESCDLRELEVKFTSNSRKSHDYGHMTMEYGYTRGGERDHQAELILY